LTNPTRNSIIMFFAFIIGALVNYVYNISMVWLLTPEQYGMLGVSISFLIILSLFVTSAFPLTVTKFISGEHDVFIKHRVFKSALSANITIAVILSVLFYFGYTTGIIDLGEDYYLLVICIILSTIITSIMIVYASILQGTFRFSAFAGIGVIAIFGKLIVAIVLVQMGLGAFGAILGLPISAFIGLILIVILTKDFTFHKTKGWAGSNVFFFALPMFFGTLGTTLLMNIDIIGVKFLTEGALSDTLSGYYRAALILAQLPVFLAGALMSVMFPYISKHTGNDLYSLKSIKYSALFILPVSLVIAAVPDAFILLIFPPEYITGALALGIVAPGLGFLAMIMVFTNIFQARHAPKIPAIVLSAAVVIEIISLIRLIPDHGITGAAASTTIACGFGVSVLAIWYIRMYKYKPDYFTVVKTVVTFSLLILLAYIFPGGGSIVFICYLVFLAGVYFILLAIFSLLSEEDISIFISGLPEHRVVTSAGQAVMRLVIWLNRL